MGKMVAYSATSRESYPIIYDSEGKGGSTSFLAFDLILLQ